MAGNSQRFQNHLSALAHARIKDIQGDLGEYSEYKAVSIIIEIARQKIQQVAKADPLDGGGQLQDLNPQFLSSLQTLVTIVKPEALQPNKSLFEQIDHFVAKPFTDLSVSIELEDKMRAKFSGTIFQTVVYLGASVANPDLYTESQTYSANSQESQTASALLEQVPDLDLEGSLVCIAQAIDLSVTERLFAQLYECNRLINCYSALKVSSEMFTIEQYFLFNAYTSFKLINKSIVYPSSTESIAPVHVIFLDLVIKNPLLLRHVIVDIVQKVQTVWVQQFVQMVMETAGEKKVYEILNYCQQNSAEPSTEDLTPQPAASQGGYGRFNPASQAGFAPQGSMSIRSARILKADPKLSLKDLDLKQNSTAPVANQAKPPEIAGKPPVQNIAILLLCYQSLGHDEFGFILKSQLQRHYTRLIKNLSRIVPIKIVNCLIMLSLVLDIDPEHRVNHVLSLKKILEDLLEQEPENVSKLTRALFKLILESNNFHEVFQSQYPELISLH